MNNLIFWFLTWNLQMIQFVAFYDQQYKELKENHTFQKNKLFLVSIKNMLVWIDMEKKYKEKKYQTHVFNNLCWRSNLNFFFK